MILKYSISLLRIRINHLLQLLTIILLNNFHHDCNVKKFKAFKEAHKFDEVEEELAVLFEFNMMKWQQWNDISNKVSMQVLRSDFKEIFYNTCFAVFLNCVAQEELGEHIEGE